MSPRSLPLLIVLVALGAQAQWRFQPPKSEGEECGRVDGQVWTCQREKDCASMAFLVSRGNRITCNDDQERVVCCPSLDTDSDRGLETISAKKCQEYRSSVTLSNRMAGEKDYDSLFPGSVPDQTYLFGGNHETSEGEEESIDKDDIFVNGAEDDDIDSDVGILGGELARAKELPHSALIGYLVNGRLSWSCGGTLISESYVLSAAHCAFLGSNSAYVVRLGDLDVARTDDDARPQNVLIAETIVHPNYEAGTFYNDIALFRLQHEVVFDEYVAPACLHSSVADPHGMATASGWGKTGMNDPSNSQLRKVNLAFVPCSINPRVSPLVALQLRRVLPNGVDPQTMVCAWAEGKDSCNGDSGGPLILADWEGSPLPRLVGVTSFGRPCSSGSSTTDPGYYTRVAAFLPWIESVVWPDSRT